MNSVFIYYLKKTFILEKICFIIFSALVTLVFQCRPSSYNLFLALDIFDQFFSKSTFSGLRTLHQTAITTLRVIRILYFLEPLFASFCHWMFHRGGPIRFAGSLMSIALTVSHFKAYFSYPHMVWWSYTKCYKHLIFWSKMNNIILWSEPVRLITASKGCVLENA